MSFNQDLLDFIIDKKLSPYLFKGNFGLEKENVRVDERGHLALTPHPSKFGDKLKNPYITTDFSESQIEMITPVCASITEAYNFLENLQNIVSLTLEGEFLWPQSNPPILPEEDAIPIANFAPDGHEQRLYREKLATKYGKKKQLLSGIHYNFSFNEEFLEQLYRQFAAAGPFQHFKNELYLKVTRNFLKYRWLLIYLTAASPIIHQSYSQKIVHHGEQVDSESFYYRSLCSLRNSMCGYKNIEEFIISYESLESYIKGIEALIEAGKIDGPSEFYSPIRLKARTKKGGLEPLLNHGVQYLELRFLDLNPFIKNGVCLNDLDLIHLFIIYLLLKPNIEFTGRQQEIANMNHDFATFAGSRQDAKIYTVHGELVSLRGEALALLDELELIIDKLAFNTGHLKEIIYGAREKVLNPEQTYAAKLIEEARRHSYIGFHMQKARDYLAESKSREATLVGYEDLELSTQILFKDALRRGIKVELLDRQENFLRLTQEEQVEYVKQATETSKDTYSTVLIMENKAVTKAVLAEHGLVVPRGSTYQNLMATQDAYGQFRGTKIVVKPKSTNYGLGISILPSDFTEDHFRQAIEIAFGHDQTILIEEFISGKEYRFLIIGGDVVGVLHRVPANIQGDGVHSVRELVHQKNRDPLRGVGHVTPLEKIALGEEEALNLKTQGKSFDYIPTEGEVVYLRENSNISTGGDSIDVTDQVHEGYLEIALQAAQSVKAAISGVDIIIADISKPRNSQNYAVIELNFNPAMYMHCYPYQGQKRPVGDKILNLLFGIVKNSCYN